MAQRIRFISFLQILGVVLVILGHSLHEYPGDYQQYWLYRLFQTVRMPLFTFISGFLFMITMARRGDGLTLKAFVGNKVQRLLVPYFFLSVATFAPRALMSGYADDPVSLDFVSFAASLFFSDRLTIVFLWFLPVIFVLLCLAFVGWRVSGRRPTWFFAVGGALALVGYFCVDPWAWTFMSVGRVADLAIFFMVGAAYGRWKERADRWLARWWLSLGCGCVWLALFYAGELPALLCLVCSIAGLGMLVGFSLHACEWPLSWRHLDGYNYMMYLLSWFTCTLSQQVLHRFTDFPWWVYTVVALTTSIYIPWAIGKLLHRYAPVSGGARLLLWLLGHNPNRKP